MLSNENYSIEPNKIIYEGNVSQKYLKLSYVKLLIATVILFLILTPVIIFVNYIIIILIVWVVCIPFLVYAEKSYIKHFNFKITEEEIIFESKYFVPRKFIILKTDIKNVKIKRGPLDRIFKIYPIRIKRFKRFPIYRTLGNRYGIWIIGQEDPEKIQNLILNQ